MAKKILVVDDSALIRKQLGSLLDKNGYDVGLAKDGQEALDFLSSVDFDAVTMDINMPVMDGLTAVKSIMAAKPTPIVMVSSLTQDEADITFEALKLGAVDYVSKLGTMTLNIEAQEREILEKIAAAASVKKNRLIIRKQATQKRLYLANKSKSSIKKECLSDTKVVLIGASTGGPRLIEEITNALPRTYPYPVCVVQHMPPTFTANFAIRLDRHSNVEVVESCSADVLEGGKVIIAKGGHHLHFAKKASGHITVKHTPNITDNFFCPSIDEMFYSALKTFDPRNILAIELTGIGDDGANGMVELKKHGAYTIAESEETAVVYGMPREAYTRGGATVQLPFPAIVQEILKFGELNGI